MIITDVLNTISDGYDWQEMAAGALPDVYSTTCPAATVMYLPIKYDLPQGGSVDGTKVRLVFSGELQLAIEFGFVNSMLPVWRRVKYGKQRWISRKSDQLYIPFGTSAEMVWAQLMHYF